VRFPIQIEDNLNIFILNVGQGDTAIIVTPLGRVIIVDAMRPDKVIHLLRTIGLESSPVIDEIIVTHPHTDHFSAVSRLIREFEVNHVTLSPFWNRNGIGPPSYLGLLNAIERMSIPMDFVSGYSRIYPEGVTTTSSDATPEIDKDKIYLEILGPSNSLIGSLERTGKLDTNHLSIIVRLNWMRFSMIFAADAQMENWATFDNEGMLDRKCAVLKTAHHGSGNGTQWERLYRLNPRCVIISSDPDRRDHLPDLVGTAIFTKYEVQNQSKVVAITKDTGTIRIKVTKGRKERVTCFSGEVDSRVDIHNEYVLNWMNNPTDWRGCLQNSMNRLYNG
jgi:beta-lactamase superfamily II metal-dependent hydrolase